MVLPIREQLPGLQIDFPPGFPQRRQEGFGIKAAFELLHAVGVDGLHDLFIQLAKGGLISQIDHEALAHVYEFERFPAQVEADDNGVYA